MNKIWTAFLLFSFSLILVLIGIFFNGKGIQADLGTYGAGMLALAAVLVGADAYKDGLKKDRLKFTEDALVKFDNFVDAVLDIGTLSIKVGENTDIATRRMMTIQANREALESFYILIPSAEIYLPENLLEHFYMVKNEFRQMSTAFQSWQMYEKIDMGNHEPSYKSFEALSKAFAFWNLGGESVRDRLASAKAAIRDEKRRIHRLYYSE